MKYLCNVILVMGVLSVGIANADIPNYKYAELSYGTGELDLGIFGESADIDQDGFQIEGSYSFLEDQLWVFGSYADVDGSEPGVKVGVETTRLGAGWIFSASDSVSVDVSALYRKDDLSVSGLGSEDIDGLGIAVGGRANLSDLIELYGRLGYLSSDYEGAWTVDLGAVWNINERFALTLSAEYFDFDDDGVELELTQFLVGARVKF